MLSNNIRNIYSYVSKSSVKTPLRNAVSMSKIKLSINEIPIYVEKLLKVPYYNKETISNVPFPDTLTELGSIPYYYSSLSIEKELIWTASFLQHYKKELDLFLTLREEYYHSLLLGDKETARVILNKIESAIGVSMWSLQNKIFLLQEIDGLEKHKEYVGDILGEDSKIEMTVQFVFSYLTILIEDNVSADKYISRVNEIIQYLKNEDTPTTFIDYLVYKLNFETQPNYDFLPTLVFESKMSMVDRYCTFIKVLRLIPISELSNGCVQLLSNLLEDFDEAQSILKAGTNSDSNFLECLDLYTIGDYESSIERVLEYLIEQPTRTDFYPLLVKAIIRNNQKIDDIVKIPQKSVLYDILKGFYEIYLSTNKFEDSYNDIKKITFLFSNDLWSWQVRGLLEEIRLGEGLGSDNVFISSYWRNVRTDNPLLILKGGNNDAHTLNSFLGILEQHENSITLQIADALLNNDDSFISSLDIPDYRKQNFLSKIFFRKGKFEDAEENFEQLIQSKDFDSNVKGYQGFINLAIEQQKFEKAINLLVNMVLKDNKIIQQLSLNSLLNCIEIKMKKEKYNSELLKDISLPILYAIYSQYYSHDKDNMIHVFYEEYLMAHGVTKPSELREENFIGVPKELVVYFYRNVCIENIMDNSMYFETSESIRNERIKICKILISLDPSSEEAYLDEIKEITRKQIIQRGILEVEQSKIIVDTSGIMKALEKNLRENFERYKSFLAGDIKGYTSKPKYIHISLDEEYDTTVKVMMPSDEKRRLFNTIVFELRDSFVSSNEYGLDGYLSVGIRHGTLSGQLRSQIEVEELITKKDSETDKYEVSPKWIAEIYNSNSSRLERTLDNFGKTVDSLIKKLKDDWIQIRTETSIKKKGLFDFRMYINELEFLESQVSVDTTYEEVVELIMTTLWEKTDKSLEDVRRHIVGELSVDFEEAFNKLVEEIDSLKDIMDISNIRKSALQAKTSTQYELQKIASWFSRSNSTKSTNYDIGLPIDIALEWTKNIYNQQSIELTKLIPQTEMKGDTLKGLTDIAFILFDNIIKHSKINGAIPVTIELKKDNDKIRLICENKINSDIITIENKEKLDDIRKKAMNNLEYVKKEGGSGFHKIAKILSIDFNSKESNAINFDYKDNDTFSVEIVIDSGGIGV